VKTHLTLDDLRRTDASEELAALRERVAELQAETGYTDAIRDVARDENRRLREALAWARPFVEIFTVGQGSPQQANIDGLARIDAALAAEPASGETTPTQSEGLERKLFYDDRGIYIGDARAQAIRTLIHALNLAVSRGCDHCAEPIRQARAWAKLGRVTALLKAEPALKDKPMNKFDGPIMATLVQNNDALRARVAKLEKALKKFKTDMCEGWCDEADHIFSDCQGCEARAALAAEPASGEADPRLALYDLETSGLHELAFPPPPPMQGDEETARRILESRLQQGGTWLAQRDIDALAAALRQRADEATRAENEACAKIADSFTCGLCGMDGKSAAAIRARIKP
jgi:hypothetical protein